MSLQLRALEEVPESTGRIARSAFPKGNAYILLRNQLGTVFTNADFVELYPQRGQPACAPWRLALVTLLQFRENLPDRQAADAVRGRLDWKYLLGLELDDPGFDFSVLSEFRQRLLSTGRERLLLDKLLERCVELGLIKTRGQQRTDATYVLGAVRTMTRLEQIGETLRAALNDLAAVVPQWLQTWVPTAWYTRYGQRIEQYDLPKSEAEREQYALTLGADGYRLLQCLAADAAHDYLLKLPKLRYLHSVLQRYYESNDHGLRYKSKAEIAPLVPDMESPYDPEVRYRKRHEQTWVGYQVHLSESCDEHFPHLITDVITTAAGEHEITQLPLLHDRLAQRQLLPQTHLMDTAYLSAEAVQEAKRQHDVEIIGPMHPDVSWQARTAGAFDSTCFVVDWDQQRVRCPQGCSSCYWREINIDGEKRSPGIKVRFREEDCRNCPVKTQCTRAKKGRQLHLPTRELYETLTTARTYFSSEEGAMLYKKRAGIEGTISQGVRAFGFRQARYIGQAKTGLQHIASAAALNLSRLAAWFFGIDPAPTRRSVFAALAPS